MSAEELVAEIRKITARGELVQFYGNRVRVCPLPAGFSLQTGDSTPESSTVKFIVHMASEQPLEKTSFE